MNKVPLVSVIIPLYNAERYIAECIDSVLAQTWPNIEVIVVDDGSTDNGRLIVEGYRRSGIHLVARSNHGASATRNVGLACARGEYVQFLDADDILGADKIEKQVLSLENRKGFVAVCDTVHFQNGTDPFALAVTSDWYADRPYEPLDFLIKLYGGRLIGERYGGMVQPNAWLTPRSVIDKAGLWNEMRCPDDDGEYFCRVVLASEGIIHVPDIYNYYRKFTQGNSLSAQKDRLSCTNMLRATQLKAHHLLHRTDSALVRLVISRLYWENAFSFYPLFKDLALQAELAAKELSPSLRPQPFAPGFNSLLARIVGWKAVKQLQALKAQILSLSK